MAEGKDAVGLKPPFMVELSPRAKVWYGFKDGHVDVSVKIGVLKSTHRIEAGEVEKAADTLKDALAWTRLPEEERNRIGA